MKRRTPVLSAVIVAALSLLYASPSAAQPAAPPQKPAETPKADTPKADTPKADTPKVEPSKVETLKKEIDIRADAAESLAAAGDIKGATERLVENDAALSEEALKKLGAVTAEAKPLLEATKKRQEDAKANVKKSADTICGAGKPWGRIYYPCFYAGAFLASGSLMWFQIGGLHGGKTAHSLVATAIPAMGIRFPLDQRARFSIDLGLLSMLLSKDVTASNQRSGCRVNNGDFEKRLPCEGNVSISPLLGLYAGLTAGNSDIGLITLMPMLGFAKTSLDGSLRFYGGLSIGVVNLSKTINP